jgi:uncharacterized protein YceH (UPF0502 family)
MALVLDATERRIVGSLIEKALAVPDSYPMTLNALVAACNQKSNRDPEMALEEYAVDGALRALMQKGWVREMELAGGRTRRYAHEAGTQLGVDEPDLALLAELFLRGPQSAMELRTRASRMRPFASPEAVEERLRDLAARPVPYVRLLGRRAGERVARWEDLLTADAPARAASRTAAEAAATDPAPGAPPPAAAAPRGGPSDPVLRMVLERLDRVERAVEALRAALAKDRPSDDLTL